MAQCVRLFENRVMSAFWQIPDVCMHTPLLSLCTLVNKKDERGPDLFQFVRLAEWLIMLQRSCFSTSCFQGAMDLALSSDFYSQFLFGGVNITAFTFVSNDSAMYRTWEQQWKQYKDEFPDLFPVTARNVYSLFIFLVGMCLGFSRKP